MHAASSGSQRPRTSRGLGIQTNVPNESYWIGFTNGAFVYTVNLFGPPGSVSEEQALEIAARVSRAAHGQLVLERLPNLNVEIERVNPVRGGRRERWLAISRRER